MRKLSIEELNRISVEEFKKTSKNRISVILDNVRSLNNIGSAFRTSDAFLIEKIFLCGISATPPHKDIQKTALGATDSVDWEYYNDTLTIVRKLKEKGYRIYAAEQTDNSTQLSECIFPDQPLAVIFGHEVRGVDQAVINECDESIEIPQYGTKHSLNISVSVGIVLWEMVKSINDAL